VAVPEAGVVAVPEPDVVEPEVVVPEVVVPEVVVPEPEVVVPEPEVVVPDPDEVEPGAGVGLGDVSVVLVCDGAELAGVGTVGMIGAAGGAVGVPVPVDGGSTVGSCWV
jgi:hypothetical protein